MSGPVDVLEVMDDVASNILIPNGGAYADEMREARAAVAELIEADVEYDKAKRAWLDPDRDDHQELRRRLEAAALGRSTALARVQGGAE